ncbi:MAG: thermophilic metalloprotease (M29) superfamily [Parcubacteria group bacterium CG11_big_fil_rev_8_21_14_0_20_39_22]|nr:MAG: thermophilic metalloprotease (M29) superfamily [Parcubacteria group bacterium CG11_big_fil_rev_8_21_14_0_20_39_22]
MNYHPNQKTLEKYANVLVNFALGGGKGIKKGDVVHLVVYEYAKPLYVELRKAVWKAGGHVISDYRPDNGDRMPIEKDFYLYAKEHQLQFFPKKYLKGLVDEAHHTVFVLSDTDKQALKGIPPEKIMLRGMSFKPYMDWRNQKENKGLYTWTIALYGTPAMAKEAGLSEREYWKQIERACFLDKKDPVKEWKSVYKEIQKTKEKLNKLRPDKLHIVGHDADLWIKLGPERLWMGGGGRNVPSFELFTSPDSRGTEGWIRFNQPLYRYGNLITGVELWFEKGKVVKSKAKKNEKVLKQMIATENADKVGEFSLTDKRHSRIDKFMAETLFDENMGGPNGNTHLALGKAYHDCYDGDPSKVSKKQWQKMGYNDSSVHTDIVSTSPRTVYAYDKKGKETVIYKDGKFIL